MSECKHRKIKQIKHLRGPVYECEDCREINIGSYWITRLQAENNALREVYTFAKGLCMGEDWNRGTAALYYRKPLREAVAKAIALLEKGE